MKKNNLLLMLVTLAFPVLMINIEYTGISVVTPAISTALSIPLAQTNWIALIYLLMFAAFIISGGRLGDLYSAKRIMTLGLILFIIGSFVGGISLTPWQMLLGRGMQGLGAAIAFPNITSIAYQSAPDDKKGVVLGVLTGMIGLSMAIGPPLAGLVTTHGSWRWFFLINIPIGIFTTFIIYLFLPVIKSSNNLKEKVNFDFSGMVLLSILLGSIIYTLGLMKNGFDDFILLGSGFIIIFLSLVLFIYNENRVKQPLILFAHLKNTQLVIGCLIRSCIHFGVYIVLFIMGLYLVFVMEFSAYRAGLILFPMSIAMGLFSFISGKLIDRYGPYIPTVFGIILLIVCYIGFMLLPIRENISLIMVLFAVYGIAYTLTSPGLMKLTLSAVDESTRGLASGLFYMMSLFGSTVGLAVTGLVLHCYSLASEKLSLIAAFLPLMGICLVVAIGALITLLILNKFDCKRL
ncbi:MFS transporter [Piscirickettsia litoralis]|uniref:MFS transporter n=1 Tax=Piscirickettsia litoralis TaxID=1891921 RepID=A0ABX3A3N0_9GAMM|nr:MFS transporter [Piscirickettsia litoralis]ODN43456.1 MFS transporter [Piscirickettsia litoralis]